MPLDALSPQLKTLLERISGHAQQQGIALYVVGGTVRDLLLGKTNIDIDLVVEGDAIVFVRSLVERYGGEIRPYAPFGTATWLMGDEVAPFIDFATTRTETYAHPAALPTVMPLTAPGGLADDLRRRDFTINAMAIRLAPPPAGVLVDLHGGETDLWAGIIRVLHDRSFVDDPTRIFRAVRFEQRLGFRIEPQTEALISGALPYIRDLSGKRVLHELDLILREAFPEKMWVRLNTFGVLAMLDVRLEFDEWLEKVFALAREHIAHPLWEPLSTLQMPDVYWAILACRLDSTDTLVARLPLNRTLVAQMDEGQRLYQLCRQEPDFGAAEPPSVIVRRLEDISPKLSDTALVAACCAAESAWRARETLIRYAQKWRHVHPVTTGNDLIAMGLRPGPLFGRLLTRLRDYWLDGRITDPAHERQYLERWLSGTGAEEEHDGH